MSTRVAALSELTPGAPTKVVVDGQPVVLVRFGGMVRALHDTCSHAQASLSEGEVYDREIECPLHGATFNVDTGAATCLPATRPVPTYPVTVDGDDVLVDATEPMNGAPVPDHY